MYVSSYTTLNTALSGVEAAQEQLDTTGQNISNQNTAGYTEQTVTLTESASVSIAGGSRAGARYSPLDRGEGDPASAGPRRARAIRPSRH